MRKKPPVRRSRVRSIFSAVSACSLQVEPLENRMLLSGTSPTATPAAQVLLSNGTWTSVGPTAVTNGQVPGNGDVSGRIAGIALDPTNNEIYYVSSADGGVFKTTDGGQTWTGLTDLQTSLVTGAIAVAPGNSKVVYVGLGESSNSQDSYYGKGILRSLDGGQTWTLVGQQFSGQTFAQIAVDPNDPGTLLVAVDDNGVNGSATATAGIYMSTDGGINWTDTTTNYSPTNFYYSVVYNPDDPLVAYSSFSSLTNGQNGIYETTDGGQTWTASSIGSSLAFGRISLAVAPSDPTTVYAAIENNFSGDLGGSTATTYYPGYIAKSVDGGATFVAEPDVPIYSNGQGFYDNSIAVDPNNADIVYVGGSTDGTTDTNSNPLNGVLESDDGGATFHDITVGTTGTDGPKTNSHALAVTSTGQLLNGTDGGLWRLDGNFASGTVTWTDLNAGLNTTQIVNLALSESAPGEIAAGAADNGTILATGSSSFKQINTGNSGFVAIDPTNSQVIYASSPDGQDFFAKSTDGGTTFVKSDTGITDEANASFNPPFEIDPNNDQRILLGTDGIWESLDGATTWTEVGVPGTSGFNPNSDPVTAVATGNAGDGGAVIYAATYSTTDGGQIFFTNNDGITWTQIDLPTTNLPAGNTSFLTTAGRIGKIVVDNLNTDTAYVVQDGFAANSGSGHVFETQNAGTTWRDISGNLPNVPFHALGFLQTGQNGFYHTLYAGGDDGLYVSYDDGYIWQTAAAGLPNAIVTDIEVDPTNGVIAAGLYGRGIYELSTSFPGATIGNFVFNDVNASGSDVVATDPGVAGATLQLFSPGVDGIIGTSDDVLIQTTTSNAQGAYEFTNVPTGSYYIHATAPTGYFISPSVVPSSTSEVLQTATSTLTLVTTLGNSANVTTGDTGLIRVTGGTVFPTQSNAGSIGMYEKTVSVSSPYVGRPQTGTGILNFVVTITPANTTTVTIPYTTANGTAIAGTDYTTTSGTLFFAPGVTSLTVPVTVLPSDTVQTNKTVILNLSPPTGLIAAATSATGLIINDIYPIATATSVTVTANASSSQIVPVVINLSTPAPFSTAVDYTTVDGSAGQGADYTATSGTVTFAAGQTSATIDVTVMANSTPSVTRQLTVELNSPVAIALNATSNGTITILETVSPAFSVDSPTVTESLIGKTVLPFTVSLTGGQPAVTTVNYTTVDGTALAGNDYTGESGTLTFAPGQVSQVVNIPVTRKLGAAATKTLSLILSTPGSGAVISTTAATGVGTIIDVATVSLPFGGKAKAVYIDNIGQKVTVSMKGSGTGSVIFLGSVSNHTDAFEITTTGTDDTSILTVAVAGGGQTSVSALAVDSSIGTITAKTLNVTGTAVVSGSAYAINLGYLAGSTLTIGSGASQSVALAFRRVTNATINSTIAIRSLTAIAYIDTLGTPIFLTAPSVGTIKVQGNFGGTVSTATLSSLSVGGSLTGASINATDGIGSITAGSIIGSSITAGVQGGLTALPASEAAFVNKSASIGSVRAGTFSDSNIASWDVHSVSLNSVKTVVGGQTFGVSGGSIGKFRAKTAAGKAIKPDSGTTSDSFQNFKAGTV